MKEKNKRVDSVAGGVESPDNWLDADFVNQSQEELENVVRASGVAFDGNNEQQVAQAITDHALGASYAEDTGTTNNYILSITGSRQVPPALVKGYCLFFQTGNVNTSTTPTLNYAGLGVKTIIDENGTNAILPGDIKVGVYNQVVYDGTNWRLVLPRVPNASQTVAGIIKTATADIVNAGTDNTTALTPLQFKTFLASVTGNSKTENGWTYLSNGIILQWGLQNESIVGTFPITFPKACFGIQACINLNAFDTNSAVTTVFVLSTSQFRVRCGLDNNNLLYWFSYGC